MILLKELLIINKEMFYLIEMFVEREVLLSILKATREGSPTKVEVVSKDFRVPLQLLHEIIRKFAEDGLITILDDRIVMDVKQRIRAAVMAIRMGGDPERVCSLLRWGEFEDLSALAFEMAGFSVRRHLRFRWAGRWWEIDILGFKRPIIVSVDCKQWRKGWSRSAIIRAVDSQIERTRALAEALPSIIDKFRMDLRGRFTIIPIILSLIRGEFKFYRAVPIVPILQLPDFLREMIAHIGSMAHFDGEIDKK